ncbi:MAG: LPXTG cell wall anchor domain-containing protein [Oscillospiraceae bacterium]|nr:LPXTG cell wall anchor domain-containing protein [Oscillospiraceae bacterium]
MKIIRKIFACFLAAAVMCCSSIATVGAVDYVVIKLDDVKPKAGGTLAISEIMNAIKSGNPYYVEIETGTDTKLDENSIALLKTSGLDVKLKNLAPTGVDGLTYNVDIAANQVAKMPNKSFDFGTVIQQTTEDCMIAVGNTIINRVIAKDSYIIMSRASGNFGFAYDLKFNVNVDSRNRMYLYYISDDGRVLDAAALLINNNGAITITMSHASAFILTAEQISSDGSYSGASSGSGSSSGGSSAGGSSDDNTGEAGDTPDDNTGEPGDTPEDNTGEAGDTPDDNTGEADDTPDVAKPDEFESNGVTATADDGVIPAGAVFTVEPISSDNNSRFSYEINFTVNGEKVQPNGYVTVKIPVPEALAGKTIFVYRVSDSGTYIRLSAEVVDGYVVFKTNHFSEYILSATRLSNPIEDDDDDDDISASNSTDTSTDNNNSGTAANPDTGVAGGITFTLGLATLAGATVLLSKKKR